MLLLTFDFLQKPAGLQKEVKYTLYLLYSINVLTNNNNYLHYITFSNKKWFVKIMQIKGWFACNMAKGNWL